MAEEVATHDFGHGIDANHYDAANHQDHDDTLTMPITSTAIVDPHRGGAFVLPEENQFVNVEDYHVDQTVRGATADTGPYSSKPKKRNFLGRR